MSFAPAATATAVLLAIPAAPPIGEASHVMTSESLVERVALTVTSSAATAPPLTAATAATPLSVEMFNPEAVNAGISLSTEMASDAIVSIFPPSSVTVMVKVWAALSRDPAATSPDCVPSVRLASPVKSVRSMV